MGMEAEVYFSQATGHFGSVPWHFMVVAITMAVLVGGVLKGIEKVNRIMMPAFFILFIIIAVRVFFLDGALAGYEYLLIPRWELLLKPETWVMAMGQAFFSLSITGSGMIIYGSYLDKKEDIPKATMTTALLDTVAALLAGFAIIPAVFAFQMDPASGPPLMFITLPKVFAQIPAGRWVAVLFFLSVLFAGITSLVNMFEVCAEAVQTHLHFSRKKAVFMVGSLVFLVGLFIEYEPYMGSWMDMITIYVVPFGAVLCAIMIYWVLGSEIKIRFRERADSDCGDHTEQHNFYAAFDRARNSLKNCAYLTKKTEDDREDGGHTQKTRVVILRSGQNTGILRIRGVGRSADESGE